MADEDIVGIIQVPLNAFIYPAGKGRSKDPAVVQHLSDIFREEGCKPDLWEHHIKGEIDAATYNRILIILDLSEDTFRNTVQTGRYPRLLFRKRIACLDGRHRIAAARRRYGKEFWWPVKLYRGFRVSRFSHETKYPDGDICWNIFRLALGKTDLAEDWGSELSKSKKKILRLLLRRENGVLKHKDIVASLCAVLEFPGTRKGFKLGNMHKYTPLQCPEKIVHYLRHISQVYRQVVDDSSLVCHMDSKSIDCLERRNPSNAVDRKYIQHMLDSGKILQGIKNASDRQRVKQNLLSLDVLFPSLNTFHQNMIYFSMGAKILRNHVIDDIDKFRDGIQKEDAELFQSLCNCWTPPNTPLIEVSEGFVRPIVSMDANLACMLLFLDAQRDCLYLSNEPILQDRRGEPAPVAAVDPWYVLRLRARARQLGFRTAKINLGLGVEPPMPRIMNWDLDWNTRAKYWRGGKPTIRNFLDLQQVAFLPTLDQADGRKKITAAFVQKDFLEAFFGPWSYRINGSEISSDLPPFPGEEMQVDGEEYGPSLPQTQPRHGDSRKEPHSSRGEPSMEETSSHSDWRNSLGTQSPVPSPEQQVTRDLALAETLKKHQRRRNRLRSKSTSRSPISRYLRPHPEPKVDQPGRRSPIRPPSRAISSFRARKNTANLGGQSSIDPVQSLKPEAGPSKRSPILPPSSHGPSGEIEELEKRPQILSSSQSPNNEIKFADKELIHQIQELDQAENFTEQTAATSLELLTVPLKRSPIPIPGPTSSERDTVKGKEVAKERTPSRGRSRRRKLSKMRTRNGNESHRSSGGLSKRSPIPIPESTSSERDNVKGKEVAKERTPSRGRSRRRKLSKMPTRDRTGSQQTSTGTAKSINQLTRQSPVPRWKPITQGPGPHRPDIAREESSQSQIYTLNQSQAADSSKTPEDLSKSSNPQTNQLQKTESLSQYIRSDIYNRRASSLSSVYRNSNRNRGRMQSISERSSSPSSSKLQLSVHDSVSSSPRSRKNKNHTRGQPRSPIIPPRLTSRARSLGTETVRRNTSRRPTIHSPGVAVGGQLSLTPTFLREYSESVTEKGKSKEAQKVTKGLRRSPVWPPEDRVQQIIRTVQRNHRSSNGILQGGLTVRSPRTSNGNIEDKRANRSSVQPETSTAPNSRSRISYSNMQRLGRPLTRPPWLFKGNTGSGQSGESPEGSQARPGSSRGPNLDSTSKEIVTASGIEGHIAQPGMTRVTNPNSYWEEITTEGRSRRSPVLPPEIAGQNVESGQHDQSLLPRTRKSTRSPSGENRGGSRRSPIHPPKLPEQARIPKPMRHGETLPVESFSQSRMLPPQDLWADEEH